MCVCVCMCGCLYQWCYNSTVYTIWYLIIIEVAFIWYFQFQFSFSNFIMCFHLTFGVFKLLRFFCIYYLNID